MTKKWYIYAIFWCLAGCASDRHSQPCRRVWPNQTVWFQDGISREAATFECESGCVFYEALTDSTIQRSTCEGTRKATGQTATE